MKWNLGRIAAAVLGLITVLALVFGANQYRQAETARLAITGMQQRAMFSLISHVENMEGCLANKQRFSPRPGPTLKLPRKIWGSLAWPSRT